MGGGGLGFGKERRPAKPAGKGRSGQQPARQKLAAEVLGGGSQAGVDHMKQENWIEKNWSCPRFVTWSQGAADKDLGDSLRPRSGKTYLPMRDRGTSRDDRGRQAVAVRPLDQRLQHVASSIRLP